jgi:hypothetical protein
MDGAGPGRIRAWHPCARWRGAAWTRLSPQAGVALRRTRRWRRASPRSTAGAGSRGASPSILRRAGATTPTGANAEVANTARVFSQHRRRRHQRHISCVHTSPRAPPPNMIVNMVRNVFEQRLVDENQHPLRPTTIIDHCHTAIYTIIFLNFHNLMLKRRCACVHVEHQ